MAQAKADDTVQSMIGIGSKSAKWLEEVGITSASQVRKLGAVECYARVLGQGTFSANLNLLWALQGAIEDMHWTLIDPKQRTTLQAELTQRLTQDM